MRERPLHWVCPSCRLEWLDVGEGFVGQRYSACLRCGTDACEPADAVPTVRAARSAAPTR